MFGDKIMLAVSTGNVAIGKRQANYSSHSVHQLEGKIFHANRLQ